jgi:uncharacterized membrane protein (UPF0127 family)
MTLTLPLKSIHFLLVSVLFISATACAKEPDANIATTAPSQQSEVDEVNANIDSNTDKEADARLAQTTKDGKITLKIGKRKLSVEYADSHEERALGLMYRRVLCEDCGMLFKFDSSRVGSIWMKNTFIPLDLAYITAAGKIVDILQLQPHDLTPVRSSMLVLYALEMNEGWFAKQDIRVGDKVDLLP